MKIGIIGSGFSGLSSAAYLAQQGYEVHVFEKHSHPGGRARQFETEEGFLFDMGPSWYWMPDIIESFFNDFGFKVEDFLEIVSLDPQFEMVFSNDVLKVPKDMNAFKSLVKSIEPGSDQAFEKFMRSSETKYNLAMKDYINKPSNSWSEFLSPKMAVSALKLDLLTNFRTYVSRYFNDYRLRSLMEFPVIFLGAAPQKIPAMYSLMIHGGYGLGTFYPMGGFFQLVLAMYKIALSMGVNFHFSQNVQKINVNNGKVKSIVSNDETIELDAVICSCDYHHGESLLDPQYRNYDDEYWSKKTFAPSALIFYLGIKGKIEGLLHHTLFFENDLDPHVDSIYNNKEWPTDPLFYVCCPSKTDPNVAPTDHENLFVLIPIAIGLHDDEKVRESYLSNVLNRIEKKTKTSSLKERIIYKKSYSVSDFKMDYNAYGGNAYGLANTLSQTAVLKPKIRNKKVDNLFYTGQLTVPGPGVPPAIISGKIVAKELEKAFRKSNNKVSI